MIKIAKNIFNFLFFSIIINFINNLYASNKYLNQDLPNTIVNKKNSILNTKKIIIKDSNKENPFSTFRVQNQLGSDDYSIEVHIPYSFLISILDKYNFRVVPTSLLPELENQDLIVEWINNYSHKISKIELSSKDDYPIHYLDLDINKGKIKTNSISVITTASYKKLECTPTCLLKKEIIEKKHILIKEGNVILALHTFNFNEEILIDKIRILFDGHAINEVDNKDDLYLSLSINGGHKPLLPNNTYLYGYEYFFQK